MLQAAGIRAVLLLSDRRPACRAFAVFALGLIPAPARLPIEPAGTAQACKRQREKTRSSVKEPAFGYAPGRFGIEQRKRYRFAHRYKHDRNIVLTEAGNRVGRQYLNAGNQIRRLGIGGIAKKYRRRSRRRFAGSQVF